MRHAAESDWARHTSEMLEQETFNEQRRAMLASFVRRVETIAFEAVDGPQSAFTENGTIFQTYSFGGLKRECEPPKIAISGEGPDVDDRIERELATLVDLLREGHKGKASRLVWRTRPYFEVESDGLIWLRMRLAWEPIEGMPA